MPLPIGKNRLLQASDQRRIVKWFACSVGRWRNPHSLAEWRNALLARRSNRHLDLRQRLRYAKRCHGRILPWNEKDPFKQKIHSVGERVVAFVLVGRGGLAGGLGSTFGWAGLDLPGARFS
jgi:hypothetical protein